MFFTLLGTSLQHKEDTFFTNTHIYTRLILKLNIDSISSEQFLKASFPVQELCAAAETLFCSQFLCTYGSSYHREEPLTSPLQMWMAAKEERNSIHTLVMLKLICFTLARKTTVNKILTNRTLHYTPFQKGTRLQGHYSLII